MSTKWQESCLRALMEGPSSYKIFEKSSYNRQAVLQYRSRLFPMYVNKKKKKQKPTKELTENQIAWFEFKKEILKGYLGDDRLRTCDMTSNGELSVHGITGKDAVYLDTLKLKKQYEYNSIGSDSRFINAKPICKIYFGFTYNGHKDTDFGWYSDSNSYSISSFFRKENSRFRTIELLSDIHIHHIEFSDCNDRVDVRLPSLLQSIEECLFIVNEDAQLKPIPATKGKIAYCNFGIEIEYEGTPVPNSLKSKLLQLGAVDFNSGIDNSMCTVEDWHRVNSANNKPDRLYEVRLRIDGFRGLPALYHLVDYMLNTNCHIPTTGSIHCHVDHAWDKPAQINKLNSSLFRDVWLLGPAWVTQENKLKLEEVFKSIFNFDKATFAEFGESGRCNIQLDFETIEYRFMTPLLNYKSIVADIMTVSHMDQCYKQNKPLNLSLLTAIDKVKKEVLNQRPIQSAISENASVQTSSISEDEMIDVLAASVNFRQRIREHSDPWRHFELISQEQRSSDVVMLDGERATDIRTLEDESVSDRIWNDVWMNENGEITPAIYINLRRGRIYGQVGERLRRYHF